MVTVGEGTFQEKTHLLITLVGKPVFFTLNGWKKEGSEGSNFWRLSQVAWLWEFTRFQEYVQAAYDSDV